MCIGKNRRRHKNIKPNAMFTIIWVYSWWVKESEVKLIFTVLRGSIDCSILYYQVVTNYHSYFRKLPFLGKFPQWLCSRRNSPSLIQTPAFIRRPNKQQQQQQQPKCSPDIPGGRGGQTTLGSVCP